jgi:hypothetical protein
VKEGHVPQRGHSYGWTRSGMVTMEANSGNMERAIKHWKIAASAGCFCTMYHLIHSSKKVLSAENHNSILPAYNNSCAEMRSESRETYLIQTENRLNYK